MRQFEFRPIVDRYFTWVQKQFDSQGFLPSSPLTKALFYALERREGLKVYLSDPDVPIDINHLERALRAIPMGRKLDVLLDREGCRARRYRAKSVGDLPAP